MITNVEKNQGKYKAVNGIGLYKINYELTLKGNDNKPNYTAGIIAYNSEEAVNTLAKFCRNKIKNFQSLKINELAFEGLCHEMSDAVKDVMLMNAIREGKVVATELHQQALDEAKAKAKKTTRTKKSIIPKE